MNTLAPIRFYFDYISPYAYLASTQIRALGAKYGRAVTPIPVLFAAMLDASGARGPAEIPAKREYMFRDVNRLARMLDVPIAPPATHPFHPLLALRATTAAAEAGVTAQWRLVDALYRAVWVEGRRIDQAEVVSAIAGAELVERAQAPDVKTKLRDRTAEAIAAGAFGVPTILADAELFWGVDSLPLLARFLGGERLDASTLERWRALVPSAVRPGSA